MKKIVLILSGFVLACAPTAMISDLREDVVKVQGSGDDMNLVMSEARRGCAIHDRHPVPIGTFKCIDRNCVVKEHLFACRPGQAGQSYQSRQPRQRMSTSAPGVVVAQDTPRCDHFVIRTREGYTVAQWHGGVAAIEQGDSIRGDLTGQGIRSIQIERNADGTWTSLDAQVMIESSLDEDTAHQRFRAACS